MAEDEDTKPSGPRAGSKLERHLGDATSGDGLQYPSQEEPVEFTDRSNRFAVLIVVGLAALVAAGFAARPVYRWLKGERAVVVITEAEAAFARGDLESAGEELRVALGLAPRAPRVLRLAAKYCSRMGLAEGLNYWQMLLATPSATREDKLAYADLALALNRVDLTSGLLGGLLIETPTDPEVLRRIIRHFVLSERREVALNAAREWLKHHPTDVEAQFTVASLLVERFEPESMTEGRGLLWGIALGQGAFRDESLVLLVRDTGLNKVENELLLKTLRERGATNTAQQVAIATVKLRLAPGRRVEIARELVQSVPVDAPPMSLGLAGNWLVDQKTPDAALELLTERRCAGSTQLLSIRVRALAALGRWQEIQPVLDRDPPVLEPFLVHCFRAQMDLQQGRAHTVAGHFENALTGCSNRPVALVFVAAFAEDLGQTRAAIAAHERRLQFPPVMLDAARAILRLSASLEDVKTQRTALRKLAEALPGDPTVIQENAYLGLLLNEKMPAALASVRELQAHSPANLALRGTLALGEVRQGNATTALTLLETDSPDWSQAPPRWQAVYVAALGASQQREAARQMARKVDLSRLKAEEKALVTPWL